MVMAGFLTGSSYESVLPDSFFSFSHLESMSEMPMEIVLLMCENIVVDFCSNRKSFVTRCADHVVSERISL